MTRTSITGYNYWRYKSVSPGAVGLVMSSFSLCMFVPVYYYRKSIRLFSKMMSLHFLFLYCHSPNRAQTASFLMFRDHTQTLHTRQNSSGRGIRPSRRTLPNSTQNSPETNIHTPAGFEPAIPASEQPETHALDRTVTEIRKVTICCRAAASQISPARQTHTHTHKQRTGNT